MLGDLGVGPNPGHLFDLVKRTQSSVESGNLIAACRSGDSEAWEQLVDRYHNLVFAIAVREGLTVEDAADVTQTTFEALLGQLDRIRDDSKMASWLMTVARRQAWRVRNRRSKHPDLVDEINLPDDSNDGDRHADQMTTALWVYEAVSQLDEPCRSLITSLYFDPESPSYAEIAAKIRRPVGSIGPSRARCLERLRRILGEVDWR